MKSILCLFAVLAIVAIANAQVSRQCLDCICRIESGCRPLQCKMDVGSLSCGYYQIKRPYYIDCGQPGKRSGESTDAAWQRCSKDKACAEQCVQGYMHRYAAGCQRNPTCEVFARVHNGGPVGCKRQNTVGYWNKVKQCL